MSKWLTTHGIIFDVRRVCQQRLRSQFRVRQVTNLIGKQPVIKVHLTFPESAVLLVDVRNDGQDIQGRQLVVANRVDVNG